MGSIKARKRPEGRKLKIQNVISQIKGNFASGGRTVVSSLLRRLNCITVQFFGLFQLPFITRSKKMDRKV